MSDGKYFTKEEIHKLKELFERYKKDKNLTLKDIANELNRDAGGIGKWLKKLFGNEYTGIAKEKSKWNKIISDDCVYNAFEEYKDGKTMKELAQKYSVESCSLATRLRKIIGEPYKKISKVRRLVDSHISKQKVTNEKIKEIFELYKREKISLVKLAKRLGITESSLINRFIINFGKEYRRIAKSRRDERKVTKEKYKEAFKNYKSTNMSLTQLADELGIRVSTLRPIFLRMFGKDYLDIAKRKQDLIECDRRGNLAEELTIEFLKLLKLEPDDVRNKCILEGTLKRPDFILDNKFIEVKTGYLTLKGFSNIKGYNRIISDYSGKKIKGKEKKISFGIIVCLDGFSPEVRNQAKKDKTVLIGPLEMQAIFEGNNRTDLVEKLNHIRTSEISSSPTT